MKILTVEEMRQAEQECARIGVSTDILMENAGKAVAEEVRRIFGVIEQKRILFLIGPGNNGGDGMVAARYLHDWGSRIDLYLFGGEITEVRVGGDPLPLSQQGASLGSMVSLGPAELQDLPSGWGLEVDVLANANGSARLECDSFPVDPLPVFKGMFPGESDGRIVDYTGVWGSLEAVQRMGVPIALPEAQ